MVTCAACGLTKSSKTKDAKISFHKFPMDPSRREAWILFTKKMKWSPILRSVLKWCPIHTSVLCCDHFTKDCFLSCTQRNQLKATAIPTIEVYRARTIRSKRVRVHSTVLTSTSGPVRTDSVEATPSTPLASEELKITRSPNVNAVSPINANDTPREIYLKIRLLQIGRTNVLKSKRIKRLQEQNCRRKKKITTLKRVIQKLQQRLLHKTSKKYYTNIEPIISEK